MTWKFHGSRLWNLNFPFNKNIQHRDSNQLFVFRCWTCFFKKKKKWSSYTYQSVLQYGNQTHGSTCLLLQQQTYYQILVPMKLIPHCMACHSFSPIQNWKTKMREVIRQFLEINKAQKEESKPQLTDSHPKI